MKAASRLSGREGGGASDRRKAYERESIVNPDSNRWSFKQELAVGKRLADKA